MKKVLLSCAAFACVAAAALPAMAQPSYGGGGYGGRGGSCSLDEGGRGGRGGGGRGPGGYGGYGGGFRGCSLAQLNAREQTLRSRIDQCLNARQMTSSAGFNLLLDLARIEQSEDRATQDQELTRFEYANLMSQLDSLSRRIEFACRGLTVRPEVLDQNLEVAPDGDRPRPGRGDGLRDRNDRRDGRDLRDGRDIRRDGDDDRRGRDDGLRRRWER
jgi:hypothetical protein